jgi:AcrR family transcriptional regulator
VASSETRAYRSDLRAQQAAQTRTRVVDAAARVFATQGYAAATLAGIARAAGVSVETVKSTASKAELLLAAFERAFAGEEGAPSLADTDAAAGVLELPDGAFVDAVVDTIASANARAHALWTVLSGAALSDATVGVALESMLERRRADFALFAHELARRALVPVDAEPDAAAELSFLFSPEGYTQLVAQSGWSREHYRAWLAARVRAVGRT